MHHNFTFQTLKFSDWGRGNVQAKAFIEIRDPINPPPLLQNFNVLVKSKWETDLCVLYQEPADKLSAVDGKTRARNCRSIKHIVANLPIERADLLFLSRAMWCLVIIVCLWTSLFIDITQGISILSWQGVA